MFSIPSAFNPTTFLDSHDMLEGMIGSPTDAGNQSNPSPRSIAEAKAAAASNSHKEAERRRRKRINGHIATLKSILPDTVKTDKASLLSETVRQVKELKKTTAELQATLNNDDSSSTSSSLKLMLPSETDELKLCHCNDYESGLIKATMSCDDRPEMMLDLIQAVKWAEAKVVRAEMCTVGGRTKMGLWVKLQSSASIASERDGGATCLGTLKRALKMVMDKSTLLAGSGQGLPGNKRPRYYHL